MNRIIIFSFLIILLFEPLYSQEDGYISRRVRKPDDITGSDNSFQIGFRIDYNFVSEKTITNADKQPVYEERIHSHSGNFTSPLSFYLPFRFTLDSSIAFEFRPGLILAGDEISTYTFGLLCYWHPFKNSLYLVMGLENGRHLNNFEFSQQPGIMSRITGQVSGHNDDLFHSSLVIGAGYKFNRTVSMDCSFRKPLKEQYGFTQIEDNKNIIDLPKGKYPMLLYWMIRIGANFYF